MNRLKRWWNEWSGFIKGVLIASFIICLIGAGVIAIRYKCSTSKDSIQKEALILHQTECKGHVTLISTSHGYGESTSYCYQCDKCGKVFEFYDNDIPRWILFEKKK